MTTMLQAMRRSAATSPDNGIWFYETADDIERATYRELDEWARHEAARLRQAGWTPGKRALLVFEPGLDFMRAVYACIYAGLIAVPVPVLPTREEASARRGTERIAPDAGARLRIASARLQAVPFDGDTWTLSPLAGTDLATSWTDPASTAADPVILQYTSGSTGDPKGVVITNANLVANQRAIATVMGLDANSIVCGWLPHYHDMGLIGLYLQSVYSGADLVATGPLQFLRRPTFWLDLVTRHRATVTVAPDFAYNLCVKLATDANTAQLQLGSLRTAITGAEPVRPETLNRFADRFAAAGFDPQAFVPAYGMAETTLLVTGKRLATNVRTLELDRAAMALGLAQPATTQPSQTVVSCGEPAPGHHIEIVDPDTGKPLAPGAIGEIWVAGSSVAGGYWNRESDTETTFRLRVEGSDHIFVRTGDLGFLADRELIITGRLKDMVIVNGRNIYATDLEHALSEALAPDGGVVAAVFELLDGGVVAAVELPADAEPAILDEARSGVAREFGLGGFRCVQVPAGWIPRTTSGKVKRSAARQRLSEATAVLPGSPTAWIPSD